MRAYQAGDEAAADQLFDQFAPMVLRIMRRATPDQHAARDLTQQTFLQVHRSRMDWDPERPIKPWILAIAVNVRRDYARRVLRRPEGYRADEASLAQLSTSATQDQPLVARDVRGAVARLPEHERLVVELHWFGGLSMGEVASTLGVSLSAVKVRAHRAYKTLRGLLGSASGNPSAAGDE